MARFEWDIVVEESQRDDYREVTISKGLNRIEYRVSEDAALISHCLALLIDEIELLRHVVNPKNY